MFNGSRKLMKLISDEEREVYDIINYDVIISAICLFGLVANVMNIMVFYRQGFNNTMNISFFGLAVSDMCSLITLLWFCICVHPLLVNADLPMILTDIRFLTGGVPYACFSRITGWITVFITVERCLCITMPLKIKQIITPKRTTGIVCFIYLSTIGSCVPEYTTSYLDWKFYPERNRTLLGLAFTSNRQSMEGMIFIVYSFLGSASFVAVIVFTVILVVQLKEKSKWRQMANLDVARTETFSVRDRKTMTTVVMIATVLIACYTPGVGISLITFIEPEFSVVGVYVNAFFVLWSFSLIFQAINSSVNIFLYYKTSTNFRETFQQTFGILHKERSSTTASSKKESH